MHTDFNGQLSELIALDEQPQQLVTGYRFLEGPVWNSAGRYLLYCDWQDHRIQRWSAHDGVEVFREASNSATGLTYDLQGRLLAAERRGSHGTDGGRRVVRIDAAGNIEAVATHYQGGRLSGPNDLICLANGDVIFTDPDGGLEHSDGTKDPREVPCNGVYRIRAADGALELITGALDGPNGLAKRDNSPELLAVEHRTIRTVNLETGAVSQFSDLLHGDIQGTADGIKLDALGNLYVGGGSEGVWVLSPTAEVLGFIDIGEQAINLAWGEDDWQTLFVVSRQSLYRIPMKVKGQQLNPA